MAIRYDYNLQQFFYDPVVLPTEPGLDRMLDNITILYASAGIVTLPPTPAFPDPVSNTMLAYQTTGLSTARHARG